MYDPVTLDQLRAFVAVVEEGSFSAAARKLRRVQSAISTAMANFETHLGVAIWDRSTKIATLTAEGQSVLIAARRVLSDVDDLRSLTAQMSSGVEANVSLCLDALFPIDALVDLCTGFAKTFPNVDLRIDTQVMSAVSARVLSGAATLGVVSPRGLASGLERHALSSIRMVPVVSAAHPLAREAGPIAKKKFADHIQIVLSERYDVGDRRAPEDSGRRRSSTSVAAAARTSAKTTSIASKGIADEAVLSPRTWRIADLHTKHMMLRAGLGWGNLPAHVIREDLLTKKLVVIRPAPWGDNEHTLHLSAIYKSDTTLGPAHRWLLQELAVLCARETSDPRDPSPRPRRSRS